MVSEVLLVLLEKHGSRVHFKYKQMHKVPLLVKITSGHL